MSECVETRLDGIMLVVRIPMRFQRRGGRKRIVAPDGSELAPSTKPQPDGTLVKALARAWRWQRMLDEGVGAMPRSANVHASARTTLSCCISSTWFRDMDRTPRQGRHQSREYFPAKYGTGISNRWRSICASTSCTSSL